MLGVVGERFPKGGAVTMGTMGGIGMLSAGLLGGPGIGYHAGLVRGQGAAGKVPFDVRTVRRRGKEPLPIL